MSKNKKTEINGETYIVSDGVDLADIDLENMTDNTDYSANNNNKTSQDANKIYDFDEEVTLEKETEAEKIWFEIFLKFQQDEEEEKSFSGILSSVNISKNKININLLLDKNQTFTLLNDVIKAEDIVCSGYNSFYYEQKNTTIFDKRIYKLESFKLLEHDEMFTKVNFRIVYEDVT